MGSFGAARRGRARQAEAAAALAAGAALRRPSSLAVVGGGLYARLPLDPDAVLRRCQRATTSPSTRASTRTWLGVDLSKVHQDHPEIELKYLPTYQRDQVDEHHHGEQPRPGHRQGAASWTGRPRSARTSPPRRARPAAATPPGPRRAPPAASRAPARAPARAAARAARPSRPPAPRARPRPPAANPRPPRRPAPRSRSTSRSWPSSAAAASNSQEGAAPQHERQQHHHDLARSARPTGATPSWPCSSSRSPSRCSRTPTSGLAKNGTVPGRACSATGSASACSPASPTWWCASSPPTRTR